jgi:RNA polymerase sigma factor (sigma-70 family)
MPDHDEELLALINACIRKKEDAWGVFIEEYGKTIAKFTKRTVKEEREDITQTVFAKLWNGGLQNFNGMTKNEFKCYLWRATTNETNTYLRSKIRQEKNISIDENPQLAETLSPPIGDPHASNDPESLAMLAEERAKLKICFEKLSLERQQIFMMKIHKGLKDQEVAAILGISEGTVASNFSRLKRELAACVQKKS